jgi:uncharacterized RDD family membrane protein YckC
MNTSQNHANPYAPPQAEVRDAVAQGEYPLAGRGARLIAAILDTLIGGVSGAPLLMGANFQALAAGDFSNAFSAAGATITVILWVVLIAATIYLVHKNGQTIGKKIVGIKVVRSDFSRASLGRIFWLRNVVNALPSLIPYIGTFYSLIDHLLIFGERRQCVHDKIADTVVVNA